MNVKVNILELASDLAENLMLTRYAEQYRCSVEKFLELYSDVVYMEGEDCTYYTDEAQDYFNEYYDFYYDIIAKAAL